MNSRRTLFIPLLFVVATLNGTVAACSNPADPDCRGHLEACSVTPDNCCGLNICKQGSDGSLALCVRPPQPDFP
jgi:hypothetical protein